MTKIDYIKHKMNFLEDFEIIKFTPKEVIKILNANSAIQIDNIIHDKIVSSL